MKLSPSKNKIKNESLPKKKVSNGIVSHKKSSPIVSVSLKKKSTKLSKVKNSTKHYTKQAIKSVLLSHVFHTMFKVTLVALFFSVVSYGLYEYFKKPLNGVVVSKSEIVDRVAKLTPLPPGTPDAIVRVEDAESLQQQNNFYLNVKSGDYILMYPKLAVIYDLRNNSIVAVKKSE